MYYNTKKLKPGLVACYDIWPGNGEGLFWFWHSINLSHTHTYLDTYRPTYSPGTYIGHTILVYFLQTYDQIHASNVRPTKLKDMKNF